MPNDLTKMRNVLYAVFALVAFSAIVVWVYIISDRYATRLETSLVKGAALRGLNGNAWTPSQLNKKVGIIYFGYTSCPDVCPTTLNNLALALPQIGSDRGRFQPIFVSVDPSRDTPELISNYVAHFDGNFLGLTGTEEELRSFTWKFGASYSVKKADAQDNDYIVEHSANLYLVNSNGLLSVMPVKDHPEDIKMLLVRSLGKMN